MAKVAKVEGAMGGLALATVAIDFSRTIVDRLEVWDGQHLCWIWVSKKLCCYGFTAYEKATVYLVWQLLCPVWTE